MLKRSLEQTLAVSDTSALTRRRERAAYLLSAAPAGRRKALAIFTIALALVTAAALVSRWFYKSRRQAQASPLSLSEPTRAHQLDRFHLNYTVRDGDTIWKIATRYYGARTRANLKRLQDANPSLPDDPRKLTIGSTLKIPIQ